MMDSNQNKKAQLSKSVWVTTFTLRKYSFLFQEPINITSKKSTQHDIEFTVLPIFGQTSVKVHLGKKGWMAAYKFPLLKARTVYLHNSVKV